MATYTKVQVKDSEDVYYIQDLNVRKKREVLQKVMSLISPIIGDGINTYTQYSKDQVRLALEAENVEDAEDADFDVFGIFSVLGSQLDNPQVIEAQDILLQGTKYAKGGGGSSIESLPDYDIESESDIGIYLKLLKVSFDVNVYVPFVQCLDEMGYSEIVGSVQAMLKAKLPA